jgi:hypothetical protein
MNRAVLAAFLCSATAPATMCDPTGKMTPFDAGQWSTLSDPTREIQRAVAAPNAFTPEVVQLPDATVVLRERPAVDRRPAEETTDAGKGLPSTSTAPDREPESGLR